MTEPTFTKEQMLVFINEVLASYEAEGAHLPKAPEEHKQGYYLFRSIRNYIQTH